MCPENVNREEIRKYAESEARWHNDAVLREYDRALYRDRPLVIGVIGIFGRSGISIGGDNADFIRIRPLNTNKY